MYAIIEDGSRQLKVEEGQELDIDFRGDLPAGEEIKFERVLAFRDDSGLKIGRPALPDAFVTAKVVAIVATEVVDGVPTKVETTKVKGPKLVVQKFRRRKNYRRRTGHRQAHTRVVIEKITIGQ
jgi:large subunit ribosomal protein L21